MKLDDDTTFCGFCTYERQRDWPDGFRLIAKGRSLDDVISSSETCALCSSLNNTLRKFECELHDVGEGASVRLDVHLVDSHDLPSEVSTLPRSDPIIGADNSSLHLSKWDYGLALREPIAPLMGSCLRECLENHRSCKDDFDGNWLPTRLIDVDKLRLKYSTDIRRSQGCRYIALSHQWGTEPFLTLTRDNIDVFIKSGIPLRELRSSFQDAIKITRQMGVRYLWIDSLCIVQGSRSQQSEWHQEAASMAFVYRNALLTLAASNAVNVQDNLLTMKSATSHGTDLSSFSFRIQNSLKNDPRTQWVISTVHERPLSRRAWVLQEHLLAPRTIHFADPMTWECREMKVKTMFSQLCILPVEPTLKVWTAGLRHKDCHVLWKQMVMEYSNCLLTVSSDKLVAISGLARIFSSVMASHYVAGLWTAHLVVDLLWETATTQPSRTGRYRALSWSWASVEGRIKFQRFPSAVLPLVTIIRASTNGSHQTDLSERPAPAWNALQRMLQPRLRFWSKGRPKDTSIPCLSTNPVASDVFGEVSSGYVEMKARLIILGTFDGRSSKTLLYNDETLRVSLDQPPSTEYGQLYLLPPVKFEVEQRYWCLLLHQSSNSNVQQEKYQLDMIPQNNYSDDRVNVKKSEASGDEVPRVLEYERLGVVTVSLGQSHERSDVPRIKTDWWPHVFYPKTLGQKDPRSYIRDDFEGTELQTLRLV